MKVMKRLHSIVLFIFVVLFSSCNEVEKFREGKTFIGDKYVSAETLNLGHLTYVEYCISCHGEKGDGVGIASKGLVPPPRDFTKGLFKFVDVPAGELPHDESLKKSIKEGLKGTAMLAWDISDQRLDAVVQYIKTFAPQVWESKEKALAKKVELISDPYVANKKFAIQKGKEVYHVVANCQSCHRAYISKEELSEMNQKIIGEALAEVDPSIYQLKLQESEYQASTIPPDFTWHEVRSATDVAELAYRIAAGVGGTAMPSWKDVITDDEIWAVSYYVRELMDLKDHPNRNILIKGFQVEEK